ncbi:MAG TPA: rod shape-determining protein MreC [bacterium]|nr:rod shape-determining protein MreC [bacterium]
MYYRRKKSWVWLFLIALLLVVLSLPHETSRLFKSAATVIFDPFLKSAGAVSGAFNAFTGTFVTRGELLRENRFLQQKVDALNGELNKLRETASENKRLSELLEFKKRESYNAVPAQVIGRDPSNWYEAIFIDKGSVHGIAPDMPVVSAQGLVGKIVEVSRSVSKVLLVLDKNSRVGAMVQSSRDYGIIEGTSSGVCRMNYLSRSAIISINDLIVSSGLGGVYPKGLVIGKVVKVAIDEFDLNKYADIEPGCDFSKLEEVLILKSNAPEPSTDNISPAQENRTAP